MDVQQIKLRKALVAEMQFAPQLVLEKLDDLEKRLPKSTSPASAVEQGNRLADQFALGMTKAGITSNKL